MVALAANLCCTFGLIFIIIYQEGLSKPENYLLLKPAYEEAIEAWVYHGKRYLSRFNPGVCFVFRNI